MILKETKKSQVAFTSFPHVKHKVCQWEVELHPGKGRVDENLRKSISLPIFIFFTLNFPMQDSKSARNWHFFSILEIKNFVGFQNVFPKLHEPS